MILNKEKKENIIHPISNKGAYKRSIITSINIK